MTPAPNDSRTAIQLEKAAGFGSSEEASLPPWERPDCFRLDRKPHRGEALRWLGFCALLAGICLVLPATVLSAVIFPPLGLLVLVWSATLQALAGWVSAVARQDLQEMAAGLRNPAGEDLTRRGGSCATVAFVLTAVCAVLTMARMPWSW